jgi:hypothetical protein
MPNTVAYEFPVAGATAPTAAQSKNKNTLAAVVTGDGASTSIVVTHNWNISAADLTAGFPVPTVQALSNAGFAANVFVASQTANAITFTCVAFTGALVRIRLTRPFSMTR